MSALAPIPSRCSLPSWKLTDERPRSLSGVKLQGTNLVRYIYADETGISEKEPVALVAGIIVNADTHWVAVEKFIHDLINEYVPEEHRENFSFHATNLFHGGGKIFDRRKYPRERAQEALRHLLSIPSRFLMPITVGYIDKRRPLLDELSFPPDEKAAICHAFAYSLCTIGAEMFMRNSAPPNEVATLVAENNTRTKKTVKGAHKILQGKLRSKHIGEFVADLGEPVRVCLPLTRIKDCVHFAEKDDAPLLQVADACAFILRYWAERKANKYADSLLDTLTDGNRHSLKEPKDSDLLILEF